VKENLSVAFLLISLLAGTAAGSTVESFELSPEPAGNEIGDIIFDGEGVWVTSDNGISYSLELGASWENFLPGISSSGLSGYRGFVVFAASHEELYEEELYPAGDGFFITTDAGLNWTNYTPEQAVGIGKLAYDIGLEKDSTIWAACFYGGLIKSEDKGESWVNVFVDTADTEINYNDLTHRFFATTIDTSTEPNTIWAGTAAGIFKSTDGGWEWLGWNHASSGISGNFIVALAIQYLPDSSKVVWASTRQALSADEWDCVSYTTDEGENWHTFDYNMTVWNFSFRDSMVYAATTGGLCISSDFGVSWDTLEIVDCGTGESSIDPEVVSVLYQDGKLFAGTSDGLAIKDIDAPCWDILLVSPSTLPLNAPKTYFFPNPFSQEKHSRGYFVFSSTEPDNATITVFNFAMEEVGKPIVDYPVPAGEDVRIPWDGTDADGEMLANGIYSYRVEFSSGRSLWGKLAILR